MVHSKREIGRNCGFTLWEVLVALALSGFLLYGLLPHFASPVLPIKQRIDQGNIVQIEGAAQAYRVDVGAYPRLFTDLLDAPVGATGWQGPYLRELPVNPWNPALGYSVDTLGRVKALQ